MCPVSLIYISIGHPFVFPQISSQGSSFQSVHAPPIRSRASSRASAIAMHTYQLRYPSSTWAMPTDIDSAYWLASTFANTLSSWDHGNAISNHAFGGGWCVDASVSQPRPNGLML